VVELKKAFVHISQVKEAIELKLTPVFNKV
jgi:hypothetical protein